MNEQELERRDMENGKRAQIDAILGSGRAEIDRFLVVSAMENREAIHTIREELKVTKQIKHWIMVVASAGVTAVILEAIHLVFPHAF